MHSGRLAGTAVPRASRFSRHMVAEAAPMPPMNPALGPTLPISSSLLGRIQRTSRLKRVRRPLVETVGGNRRWKSLSTCEEHGRTDV